MPGPLIVSIPHSLGREEAMRRLKAGLSRAASHVPILHVDEERWEDNRMIFRVRALGQAANGHVDVAEDHVKVEVTLPVVEAVGPAVEQLTSTVGPIPAGSASFVDVFQEPLRQPGLDDKGAVRVLEACRRPFDHSLVSAAWHRKQRQRLLPHALEDFRGFHPIIGI